MGLLDNSTNNIVIDAVLTDIGREIISKNDGSWKVAKFAVADDEIDYGMITKFGLAVGKDKIEKLTPVWEASTNESYALKYRAISISNPNVTSRPSVSLSGEGVSSGVLSMSRIGNSGVRKITISQTAPTDETIDPEFRDALFSIKCQNQFLKIQGFSPDDINKSGIATYTLMKNPALTIAGGSEITFNLQVKSLTDTQFRIFGNSTDKTLISTIVHVTGLSSGVTKEFEVQISST